MLSKLWGRITGKDKDLKYPDQQAVFLGRVGDYTVVFPYGLYADLPNDTLLKEIAHGVAVPVTVKRPSDTEQAEPVFFHPATNTRIIARNNGDLDIITTEGNGDVNISTVNANVTASGDMVATVAGSTTFDTPETTFTGNVTIQGNAEVQGNTTLGATVTSNGKDISDTHTHSGVTPGGGNSGPPT
jgi:hypothetical protein